MIEGLRNYRVQAAARQPLLKFIQEALIAAGCRILFVSPANVAPFIITFETPEAERIGIVAYAFLANRTPTLNRPKNERSFQIKYGTKEQYGGENLHEIWQDPLQLFTTLFIGIDVDGGFFVAADPRAHNPTKFFIRLEFKDENARAVLHSGWEAWSRARRTLGHSEPTETLVGGVQNQFLNLIRFERASAGVSAAERLRLARGGSSSTHLKNLHCL